MLSAHAHFNDKVYVKSANKADSKKCMSCKTPVVESNFGPHSKDTYDKGKNHKEQDNTRSSAKKKGERGNAAHKFDNSEHDGNISRSSYVIGHGVFTMSKLLA